MSKVDAFFERQELWHDEQRLLRDTLLGTGLAEELKWGKPTYRADGANIAIIQPMKAHLALMFFKGALMSDPHALLHFPGPNSRSGKRFQFTSCDEIEAAESIITDYIAEAIEIERQGLEIEPAPAPQFVAELTERLADDEAFRTAFQKLTPGRQREYNLQIASAKQTSTRLARIEKFAPRILEGKGFRDS